MNGEGALERRYRRLLAWYPAGHRRAYGEEMIGVLMAAAPGGARRPGLAGAADLVRGGLRARFRAGVRWFAGVESALVVLALAAPPLLALRWRRTGAVVALALAGWYLIIVFGSLPGEISHFGISQLWQWPWLAQGEGISSSLALLLGAAALAWSPGPRRGIEILTPKSWLVLIGPGVAMGLTQRYLWAQPLWLVAVIVIAALAVVAAGLVLTIPGPAGRGVLLLLAAPAYPGAVWAIGYSRYWTNHVSGFPFKVFFAPTVLFACLAVAAIWRSRHQAAA